MTPLSGRGCLASLMAFNTSRPLFLISLACPAGPRDGERAEPISVKVFARIITNFNLGNGVWCALRRLGGLLDNCCNVSNHDMIKHLLKMERANRLCSRIAHATSGACKSGQAGAQNKLSQQHCHRHKIPHLGKRANHKKRCCNVWKFDGRACVIVTISVDGGRTFIELAKAPMQVKGFVLPVLSCLHF